MKAIPEMQILERFRRKRKFNKDAQGLYDNFETMSMNLFPLLLRLLLRFVKKGVEIFPRNKTSIAKMIRFFGVMDLKN